MITTNSFPNIVTNSPNEEIKANSLIKEDLEGKVKNNIQKYTPNKNGGFCQAIKI